MRKGFHILAPTTSNPATQGIFHVYFLNVTFSGSCSLELLWAAVTAHTVALSGYLPKTRDCMHNYSLSYENYELIILSLFSFNKEVAQNKHISTLKLLPTAIRFRI